MRHLLALTVMLFSTLAHGLDIVPYTAERHQALVQSGQAHALHFHATWCGTCLEQERALDRLKGDKALAGITLLVVDYDGNKPLRKQLKVTSQSVFVVFKGRNEVARNGGETRPEAIRTLLARAL